jgi:hypothetical protein
MNYIVSVASSLRIATKKTKDFRSSQFRFKHPEAIPFTRVSIKVAIEAPFF